jgi:hypothetical protein
MIEEWMIDGAPVLYHAVFPPRISTDSYEGEIDGEPWAIGQKKDRFVVRLKNMDARYRKDYGRKVVSFTDLKFIERRDNA